MPRGKMKKESGEVGTTVLVAPGPLGVHNTLSPIVVGADMDRATSPEVGPPSPIRTPVSTLLDGRQARVSLVALTPRRLKAAHSRKTMMAKFSKAPGHNPASRRTRWLCAETERLLPVATAKGMCLECGLERSRETDTPACRPTLHEGLLPMRIQQCQPGLSLFPSTNKTGSARAWRSRRRDPRSGPRNI